MGSICGIPYVAIFGIMAEFCSDDDFEANPGPGQRLPGPGFALAVRTEFRSYFKWFNGVESDHVAAKLLRKIVWEFERAPNYFSFRTALKKSCETAKGYWFISDFCRGVATI